MVEKRPVPGKRSKFALGEDVILHGSVTRVGENDRGEEEITLTIKGWGIDSGGRRRQGKITAEARRLPN